VDRRYGGRVPLVAAAVCPHPPVIVPAVAAGAAGELDSLRAACDASVDGLLAAGADALVVVGAGQRTGWMPAGARGSFAPFGVSIEVSLAGGDTSAPGPALPLSLTVGAWLLARRRHGLPVTAASVAAAADTAACAALAAQVSTRPDRVGMLVMGDGSACRGPRSPGYDDPRAQPYDDGVARALAGADVAALRDLDPVLSAELLAVGRAPWQVLAAACAGGSGWRGELSYYAAPYGVAYFVAAWTPR
jgi:hypothetical protein